MGRAPEEPQPEQDQYHHNYDQAQETQPETYYAAGEDQPEVTNFHYNPSENTPPPPQRAPPPLPPQPVQFPPPSPQAFPPPQQGQPQPQAFPPSYGQQLGQQPQPFPPQQGQPQPFPPQQGQPGQPQPFPPQQYGQPQGYNPQQYGQQQQGYQTPMGSSMGYQGPGTPNKPVTPTGFPLPQPVGMNGWSSDLFDCMDDPENAIITACFPCVTYGQIAEIVDNGQSNCATSGFLYGCIALFIGCPCIISCTVRSKIRSRYGLEESPAPDWLTHCLCEWCALCQEYRELNFQGLDPAIGWQGNVMKQQQIQMQQQATMAAPVNQTMM